VSRPDLVDPDALAAWLDDLESRHNLFPGPGPKA